MERLKDIHFPGAIPPEPGPDWLLIGVVLLASVLAVLALARRLRMPAWKRETLADLHAAATASQAKALHDIARIMRRLAIRLDPTGAAVHASGDRYLAHLDRIFSTRFFTQGEGRALGSALYQPGPAANISALTAGLDDLIRSMRRRP